MATSPWASGGCSPATVTGTARTRGHRQRVAGRRRVRLDGELPCRGSAPAPRRSCAPTPRPRHPNAPITAAVRATYGAGHERRRQLDAQTAVEQRTDQHQRREELARHVAGEGHRAAARAGRSRSPAAARLLGVDDPAPSAASASCSTAIGRRRSGGSPSTMTGTSASAARAVTNRDVVPARRGVDAGTAAGAEPPATAAARRARSPSSDHRRRRGRRGRRPWPRCRRRRARCVSG